MHEEIGREHSIVTGTDMVRHDGQGHANLSVKKKKIYIVYKHVNVILSRIIFQFCIHLKRLGKEYCRFWRWH